MQWDLDITIINNSDYVLTIVDDLTKAAAVSVGQGHQWHWHSNEATPAQKLWISQRMRWQFLIWISSQAGGRDAEALLAVSRSAPAQTALSGPVPVLPALAANITLGSHQRTLALGDTCRDWPWDALLSGGSVVWEML